MNHTRIDQEQIAERYVLGQLSAREAAQFEEHSLSCDECLDRLEAAEGLRRGLSAVAAHEAQETIRRAVGFGLLARWARSRAAPAVLTLLLVAALIPSGVLWMQLDEARQELARVESPGPGATGPTGQPPVTGSRDGADDSAAADLAALEERLVAVERQRVAQTEQLESASAELRRLEGELERAARPRQARPAVNVPLLTLEPERSAGGEPSARLVVGEGTELVLLSLDVVGRDFASFGVTLRGTDGEVLWRTSGLVPDESGFLNLALPTSLLGDGDHRLELTGPSDATVIGRFPFRVSS